MLKGRWPANAASQMPSHFPLQKGKTEKLKNGYTRENYTLSKTKEKTISLDEIKKMATELHKKFGKKQYTIRGLNNYGVKTIKSFDGFIDNMDDYLDGKGYNEDIYNEFYKLDFTVYYE